MSSGMAGQLEDSCTNCSFVFRSCKFQSTWGYSAGTLYIKNGGGIVDSLFSFENCIFSKNIAERDGGVLNYWPTLRKKYCAEGAESSLGAYALLSRVRDKIGVGIYIWKWDGVKGFDGLWWAGVVWSGSAN